MGKRKLDDFDEDIEYEEDNSNDEFLSPDVLNGLFFLLS